MIRVTLALILAAAPAHADRITMEPGTTPEVFAVAIIHNRIGTYNKAEVEATEHGDVVIEYTTTQPHALNDPASADRACVIAMPDGVVAVPMCVDVLEQETGRIEFRVFVGG